MSEATAAGGGAPAWAPASIKTAGRTGEATAAELLDGQAWARFLGALERAGGMLRADDAPQQEADQAAGYRHLMGLLALGADEALRSADPADPVLKPGNVDNAVKWGMDCPDALYMGAPLRGAGTYRVTGNRGTVRYLGFQVMGGMATVSNAVADDLDVGPDGELELMISAEEQPGNWLALDETASTLIVRQFFYDWAEEEPASLTIERLDEVAPADPTPVTAELVARQLDALGTFVEESLTFWKDLEQMGRAEGLNRFREPAARTDMGGAAENVTVWGSWELADDEALVVEVVPPEALYWSLALGNYWWESIDYADHQSSLNGHQAVLDDGVFRAVVAHRDPGVANWLDTAGNHRGPMIFRWVRADDAPVADTRLVKLDELDDVLPSDTVRVTPEQRRQAIARRRAGVRRRFPR